MEIVSKTMLKKMMLEFVKCPYTAYVEGWVKGYIETTGTEPSQDQIDALDIPRAVYNTYFDGGQRDRGVVGLNCHVITGSGNTAIFHVDLAMESNVPDFYYIHRNVPVMLLEPATPEAETGKTHLVNPECAHRVEEILMAPAKKNHLSLVEKPLAPPKMYRWYFTGTGRLTHSVKGDQLDDRSNEVALAFHMDYDREEKPPRARSRIRAMALARLNAILGETIDKLNEQAAGEPGFWMPKIDANYGIALCESLDSGKSWSACEDQ